MPAHLANKSEITMINENVYFVHLLLTTCSVYPCSPPPHGDELCSKYLKKTIY